MQGRKEQREALASKYPWAAEEQRHFTQLGDAAMIELENAYKRELQWLDEFKGTLAGKTHADPILIVSDFNTSVQLATTDSNDSQSKRSRSSLLAEEEEVEQPAPSPVSSGSTSSSSNDEEPSAKRNRIHPRTSAELSPVNDIDNNMEAQPEVIEINSSIQPATVDVTSPSSKLTETSPSPASAITTLNTPTPTRMSPPLSPSIITGTHPFIDNTVMSTPTTTILSSKGKAGLPFNSTAHQLSNPHWHDLSPINTMSSPITSTTPAVVETTETTETTATTTATTMTTINTTAKTVETALTSASSVVSTSTRPLSSGESSKKDEEWVSPGVVRHQSLFTHFTSLSTMMTSNQKLKKQGIESSGTHKQLPTRNSTVRRDLVAELQSSVTDPQSATITAAATATVSTPKAVRASPFKPIGIAFSQQRVASMREIREENENEVEEMKASPNEKSLSLLSDEEERLREEGRVKSFFTASTEALKQRLQSLRAKSSVFVASGSSNTATPESNILAPVNAEEKQNGRVDMVEQQQQPVKKPQSSRVKIDNDSEEDEEDEEEFQDASDHTPRHSAIIDKNQDVFVDALQSPPSPFQRVSAPSMDKKESLASVDTARAEVKATTESKSTIRSRPQIKALAKAHEAAKKEQEVNAQREERKRRIEAMRLKQTQERQQAPSNHRDPMLRPSYTMTNRVKKPELSTARMTARSTMHNAQSNGNSTTTTRGPGLFKRTIQKTTMADRASRLELNKQPPLAQFTESSSTSIQNTVRTGLPTRPNNTIKPLFAKKPIVATSTSSRSTTTTTATGNRKLFSHKFDTDSESVLDELLSPMPNRMKQAAASAASSTHRTVTTSVNETNHEVTTIAVISKKSNGEIVYDLPEIESDYTDDDRTPKRPNNIANTVPHWAQPANLTQQLLQQQRVDPDRIFGRIEPIRMEAIFKGREDKYRHRTSSAHWIGTDQLTEEEEQAYRERMGYL